MRIDSHHSLFSMCTWNEKNTVMNFGCYFQPISLYLFEIMMSSELKNYFCFCTEKNFSAVWITLKVGKIPFFPWDFSWEVQHDNQKPFCLLEFLPNGMVYCRADVFISRQNTKLFASVFPFRSFHDSKPFMR